MYGGLVICFPAVNPTRTESSCSSPVSCRLSWFPSLVLGLVTNWAGLQADFSRRDLNQRAPLEGGILTGVLGRLVPSAGAYEQTVLDAMRLCGKMCAHLPPSSSLV